MIGNAEGLLGSGAELFDMEDKKQKIYRKIGVPMPVGFGFSVHVAEPYASGHPVPAGHAVEPARVPAELNREGDRLLLARYAPPSVVVNEKLEIIQTRGHTAPYLELPTGKASLDLLKMARPGLLYELQNTIEEARKNGAVATRPSVPVDGAEGLLLTAIRVTPFSTPIEQKTGFVVSFESSSTTEPQAAAAEAVSVPLADNERAAKDKHISQLKQELTATKEYLQSFIEALESTNGELQSANEEIQAGNEELQSTNEELQTSKEELESANEELHTVNDEMQRRNDLLAQLNNDLTNLLNSVSLPLVMVGPDLSVRRFTPQATRALGLNASDVGKPLSRLRLKVNVTDLEEMMLEVMADVRPKQSRVRVSAGKWYDLRMTPYRTADNRIDGVVLSIPSLDYLQDTDKSSVVTKAKPAHAKHTPARKKARNRK